MKTLVLSLFLILFLGSCEGIEGSASVDSMSITPNKISLSDTGMTDEFFEVTIKVSGFDDEIDKSKIKVYRQNPRVEAVPSSIEINANTITLKRIAKSWFGGVKAGSYKIGVELGSATQFINEQDVNVVLVVE